MSKKINEALREITTEKGFTLILHVFGVILDYADKLSFHTQLVEGTLHDTAKNVYDIDLKSAVKTEFDFITENLNQTIKLCKYYLSGVKEDSGVLWVDLHNAAFSADIPWAVFYRCQNIFDDYGTLFADVKRDMDHISYLVRTAKSLLKDKKYSKAQEYLQRAATDLKNYQPLLKSLAEGLYDDFEALKSCKFDDKDEPIPFDDEEDSATPVNKAEEVNTSAVAEFLTMYFDADKATQDAIYRWLSDDADRETIRKVMTAKKG